MLSYLNNRGNFSMNNQSYFTASTMQTMLSHLKVYNINVDYSKHKEANVLILLSTGVYLLASVNAPQRSCKTYLSDKDTTMQVDVLDIMKVTQQSVCWCEL